MTMDFENKYKDLTEKELRLLIKYDDKGALDEFVKRCDTGEIKRRTYTIEDLERMTEEIKAKKQAEKKAS